jgi:hypothetical protein
VVVVVRQERSDSQLSRECDSGLQGVGTAEGCGGRALCKGVSGLQHACVLISSATPGARCNNSISGAVQHAVLVLSAHGEWSSYTSTPDVRHMQRPASAQCRPHSAVSLARQRIETTIKTRTKTRLKQGVSGDCPPTKTPPKALPGVQNCGGGEGGTGRQLCCS